MNRRRFLRRTSAIALASAAGPLLAAPAPGKRVLRLWAMGDPHVGSDMRRKRESLADAIRQSESPQSFDWDLALCVGDFSGNQDVPDDAEGRELKRQFAALAKHRREQIYCLAGNHDASVGNAWFQTWVDPLGEHTDRSGVRAAERPYPVEGTWERYAFRAGNLLFLMMGDRNDYEPPVGRIRDGRGHGGRPPGAVTEATFRWWQEMVAENPECIIISAHHHMLKETTARSGEYEGFRRDAKGNYRGATHGYFAEDGEHNRGASYLYWLVDESQSPPRAAPDAQAFEHYLAAHPGAIDMWIGGHTHMTPDDRTGGRTHVERKWGVNFLNCAALTKHHGGCSPMSRLLTFTEGSREVRIQCYLHDSSFAPQGWYAPAERTVLLGKPFLPGN